jgi:S1-C subfamily serine protease
VWFVLIWFCCQVFYYEDETTTDFEVAKVTQSYNTGINKAIHSSVRVDIYGSNGFRTGHGSGNAFKIGTKEFVITASHVIEDHDRIIIRERDGNMIPAISLWANLDNDVAILLPLGEFKQTEVVSYVNNKSPDLDGKNLYFHGYPSEFDGLLIKGFVSKSDYSAIIMQSNAWFGSSGSVAFDQRGRAVGIVHAISVELNPFTGMPVFIETVVVVNRFYFLSRKDILGILKDASSKSRNPN